MGFFGKKKVDEETVALNELLNLAIEFNQATGTWYELPADVPVDVSEEIITVRKKVFEYIRQLKEAGYYSNGAVNKFAKEICPWINKQNVSKFISLGKYL